MERAVGGRLGPQPTSVFSCAAGAWKRVNHDP